MLARVLDKEVAPAANVAAPMRMVLTGKAGTGKSRVLQALQWYALQIGAVEVMAVVAYTWRAALLLGTPDNPACTTNTFFAIDSFKDKTGADRLRSSGKSWEEATRRLRESSKLKLIFVDEFSFLSQAHLSAMSRRCQEASGDHSRPFGGYHVVLVGDPRQHDPPAATPLVSGAARAAALSVGTDERLRATPVQHEGGAASCNRQTKRQRERLAADTDGRDTFVSFSTVINLTQQQRLDNSEAGLKLQRYAELFNGDRVAERREVEEFVDDFNAKAVGELHHLLESTPRVVTQRQKARAAINLALALSVAAHNGKRACVWLAQHEKNGEAVDEDTQRLLRQYGTASTFGRLSPALVFFEV